MGVLDVLRWFFTDDDQENDGESDNREDNRRRESEREEFRGKCEDCRYGDKTRTRWKAVCTRPGVSEIEFELDHGCSFFSHGQYEGKCKECRHNKSDEEGRYCYHSNGRITRDYETCSNGRYQYGNPS